MPTPNDPHGYDDHDLGKAPGKDLGKVPNRDEAALHSVGEGYELTDVSAGGVGGFLLAFAICIVIFFFFAFGMGKVINVVMRRSDGPASPWQQSGTEGSVGLTGKSMQSSPVIEQKQLHQLTQAFPTPRLQTDDGDQDLADLHQREDLLLTHYTYVDSATGKVRIPIGFARTGYEQEQESPTGMAGDQSSAKANDY
jgi:hypothetical protein